MPRMVRFNSSDNMKKDTGRVAGLYFGRLFFFFCICFHTQRILFSEAVGIGTTLEVPGSFCCKRDG